MNSKKFDGLAFILLVSVAAGTCSAQAQESATGLTEEHQSADQAGFRDGFSVAPYFWMTIYSGTMTVNGQTVDMTGTNVFDLLSAGDLNFPPLMGVFEWNLDNGLGIYLDTTAIGLNFGRDNISLGHGPLTAAVSLDFTYGLVNTAVVVDGRDWLANGYSNDLDYLFGVRYTYYDLDLAGTIGPVPVSAHETLGWADATAGVRLRGRNADGLSYSLHGDIGFGEGKSAQGIAVIGKTRKQARSDFSLFAGYRVLYQDWSSGNDAVDLTTHGPVLGLGWRF